MQGIQTSILQSPEEKKLAIMKARNRVKQAKKANYLVELRKKSIKYRMKNIRDAAIINPVVESIEAGETLKLITNKFDAPSLIFAIQQQYGIKNCYVSTWSITDRGIAELKAVADTGADCWVLLDTTHSYKWVFSSGAYEVLQGLVNFKFTENHSKFILLETHDGKKISFSGSMNLSNNPRFENIDISTDPETFDFYRDFILKWFDG